MYRSHRTRAIVAIAALAGALLAPAGAAAQSGAGVPDLRPGQVARERERVHPPAVHAVLQPGDAGERGQVGERGRDDANRGDALGEARHGVQLRPDQRLSVQLPRPGLGQPAADVDGGAAGRGAAGEIKKWFAAVAARYPNIEWLQVVNEPLHDPPDCTRPFNQGNNCSASGNYARALGGVQRHRRHGVGLDPQRLPAGEAVLPEHEVDAQRLQHHQQRHRHGRIHPDHQAPQAREPDRHRRGAGPRVLDAPATWGHKANLDRLAATGVPIQVTELDIDGLTSGGVPGDEVQLRNYRRIVPTFWEHPGRRGDHAVGLAPAEPLAQRPERADRALQRHAQARGALALQLRQGDRAGDPAGGRASRSATSTPIASARCGGRLGVADRSPESPDVHVADHGRHGAGIFAIAPSTGEVRVADQQLLDEHTTYTLKVRVSDGSPRERRGRRDGRHRGSRERGRHGGRRRGAGDVVAVARRQCGLRRVHARAWPASTRPVSAPP